MNRRRGEGELLKLRWCLLQCSVLTVVGRCLFFVGTGSEVRSERKNLGASTGDWIPTLLLSLTS
jgi:hypothetical protein